MSHPRVPGRDPAPRRPIDDCEVRSISVFRSTRGAGFVLRSVLPRDCLPLAAMFGRLSRMAHYNRFHGARARLSEAEVRAMTRVDHRRHVGLVITTRTTDQAEEIIVGDARYVVATERNSAEFAIVIDDPWQRVGLGERALRALIDAARRNGLDCLHGGVLEGNEPMLSLARRCGFRLQRDLTERGVMRASMDLAGACVALPAAEMRMRVVDRATGVS